MNLDAQIKTPAYGEGIRLEQLTSLTPKPKANKAETRPTKAEQPEQRQVAQVLPTGGNLPDIESAFWANKWAEIFQGNPALAENDPQIRIILKTLMDKAK